MVKYVIMTVPMLKNGKQISIVTLHFFIDSLNGNQMVTVISVRVNTNIELFIVNRV